MIDAGPSRRQRRLVLVVLVLLVVPGIVGFDAWPLTAWRLFSLARADTQTRWVLDAATEDGTTHTVSLEELPLRYRHAEWPMAELPHASDTRQEAVCQALLGAVADVAPATESLAIVRDRQQLVERDGDWVVTHDRETLHTCQPGGSG